MEFINPFMLIHPQQIYCHIYFILKTYHKCFFSTAIFLGWLHNWTGKKWKKSTQGLSCAFKGSWQLWLCHGKKITSVTCFLIFFGIVCSLHKFVAFFWLWELPTWKPFPPILWKFEVIDQRILKVLAAIRPDNNVRKNSGCLVQLVWLLPNMGDIFTMPH